jgi:hypothetical protein
VQTLTLTSSSAFEEIAEGSKKPIAEIKTHAGITEAMRYTFTLE